MASSYYDEEGYGYKVDLEVFSGPLDLLLYLIRQEEVEIADIPIARITDQYLQHIELMQQINVNLAGEFLVMAATLMEIKSRMLLPRPEAAGEEEAEDPRADLIRQLIEYKRFKDAARALAARADEQALKFTRGAAAVLGLPERQPEEDLPILLGEVTVWDLLAAFKAILRQTTLDTTRHIVLDERPASAYCNDLLDELRARGTAAFGELFDPAQGRLALINAFLALLELIRRRRVRAEQSGPHGEIRIVLLDDTPVAESELIQPSPAPPSPSEIAPAPQSETRNQQSEIPAAPAPAETPEAPPAEAPAPESEVEDILVPEVEDVRRLFVQPAEPAEEQEALAEAPVAAPRPRKRRAGAKRLAPRLALALLLRHRRRATCLLARLPRTRALPSRRGPVGISAPKRARR